MIPANQNREVALLTATFLMSNDEFNDVLFRSLKCITKEYRETWVSSRYTICEETIIPEYPQIDTGLIEYTVRETVTHLEGGAFDVMYLIGKLAHTAKLKEVESLIRMTM